MGLLRPKLGIFLPVLLLLTLACSARQAESPSVSATSVPDRPASSDGSKGSAAGQPPSTPSPPPATVTPAPPELALYTPTEPPSKVDTSVANVDLEDVVFDTFRGGYIPLDEASDQVIEALRDAIRPIYEPEYDEVELGDWLTETDLVLARIHRRTPMDGVRKAEGG